MCTSPFKVKVDDNITDVPCGRCLNCRIEYTRQWASRLIHEMEYYNETSFICLTYTDEYLPPDGVQKEALQKFFKRLRKNSQINNIKYLACGEYGEEKGRPHYHIALLGIGLSSLHRDYVTNSWSFGTVDFGTLTYASARYVAGYILKKYDQDTPSSPLPSYYNKPFLLQSKGLGLRFLRENSDQLIDRQSYTINGNKHNLPRYYRDKLGITCADYQEQILETYRKQTKQLAKYHVSEDKRRVYAQSVRDQLDKTMQAKNSLEKRDKV